MNATVLDEAPVRQKMPYALSISKKSDERNRAIGAPLIDVLPRLVRKRHAAEVTLKPGEFQRVKKPDEATGREYHTYDKPTYRTGDGDTIYALRPGALDFKSIPSRTGFDT